MIIIQVPDHHPTPPHWQPPVRRQWPRPTTVPMVALPVKSLKANVTIVDQVATTEIDQVFHNDSASQLEGTFFFPIPDSAALSDFRLEINGELVKGQVLNRDEARRIYEGYLHRYQDPALLEYLDRKLFQARIFPIPPHGDRRIQLKYTQTLVKRGKTVEYVYPLDTAKFCAVPMKDLVVTVKLTSRKAGIQNIYSPSHGDQLAVTKKGDREATVSYEGKGVRPDRDLLLTYQLTTEDIGLSCFPFRSPGEENGFALMVLSPKVEVTQQEEEAPKDIVVVMDTSGSMAGEKIEQAKRALAFCVNQLRGQDRFNLVTFEAAVTPWKPGLQEVVDGTRKAALEFVKDIRASGGTNIRDALLAGLDQLKGSKRTKILLFLTDGLPTVGEQDVERILRDVKEVNPTSTRVFAFGVGHDVNTHLLDVLTDRNHGASTYVAPQEDLEVKVSDWYAKVAQPVLTDVEIEGDGVTLVDRFPKQMPDLFRGGSIVLATRTKGTGGATIKLKGKIGDRTVTYVYEETFPKSDEGHEFVPKLWATRKVGYLMDQIRLYGQTREVVSEIEALGKQYGIVTPFTSYLVEEPGMRREVFRGWGAGGQESEALERATQSQVASLMVDKMQKEKSGAGAVRMAREAQAMSQAHAAGDQKFDRGQLNVQYVGGQAFSRDGEGGWRQAGHEKQSMKKITFGSREYFELAASSPKMRKVLALGWVMFEHRGQWYEVVPQAVQP